MVLLAFALLASPLSAVDWVSFVVDPVANVVTLVRTNGKVWQYDYTADLPLSQADLDAAKQELQNFYDTVSQRNQLPDDDPDKTTDPNNECMHWTGPGQRIVSRNTVVVAVEADADGDPLITLRECDKDNPPL